MADVKETVCSTLVDVDRRFPTVFRRKGLHASKVELRDKWEGVCAWDFAPIVEETPWPEVKAHHCDGPETFSVSWRIAFCGPSCHLAWLLDRNDHDSRSRVLALKCFAIRVMGVRTEYAPADPRSALKSVSPEHGIFAHVQDFRAANKVAVHLEREFPLVPHSIVWEERIVAIDRGGEALPGEAEGSCFRSRDFIAPTMTPFPIRGRKIPTKPTSAPSTTPPKDEVAAEAKTFFHPKPSSVEPLFQRFIADATAGADNDASQSVRQDTARTEQIAAKRRKPAAASSTSKKRKTSRSEKQEEPAPNSNEATNSSSDPPKTGN